MNLKEAKDKVAQKWGYKDWADSRWDGSGTLEEAHKLVVEDLELLSRIVNSSFGIVINLSDFFYFACADAMTIDPCDLVWILPMVKKYPECGMDACCSFIRKQMPIQPHITDRFLAAYKEIEILNPEIYTQE